MQHENEQDPQQTLTALQEELAGIQSLLRERDTLRRALDKAIKSFATVRIAFLPEELRQLLLAMAQLNLLELQAAIDVITMRMVDVQMRMDEMRGDPDGAR